MSYTVPLHQHPSQEYPFKYYGARHHSPYSPQSATSNNATRYHDTLENLKTALLPSEVLVNYTDKTYTEDLTRV
jgi:hypothetical protein